jgi:predicted nucleotidyltransferase
LPGGVKPAPALTGEAGPEIGAGFLSPQKASTRGQIYANIESSLEENLVGLQDILREKRQEILEIAAKHGAYNVRLFGSVARGEADEQSDVDILVDAGPRLTPFFPGGLVVDLEALLGRKVDVVTEKGLRRRIKDRVLKEAIPL